MSLLKGDYLLVSLKHYRGAVLLQKDMPEAQIDLANTILEPKQWRELEEGCQRVIGELVREMRRKS